MRMLGAKESKMRDLTPKMIEALEVLASEQVFPNRDGERWFHAGYVNTRVAYRLYRKGFARRAVWGGRGKTYPAFTITDAGREALEDATSGLDWIATTDRA